MVHGYIKFRNSYGLDLFDLWFLKSFQHLSIWTKSVHEKLHSISLCKTLSPWSGAILDPRDFNWTNLNLLPPRMLHIKYKRTPDSGSWKEDFRRFIKKMCPYCAPYWAPKGVDQPLYLNKSECLLPSLVEIGIKVVLEKKSFTGKRWRRTDGRQTPCHTISSHGLQSGELKIFWYYAFFTFGFVLRF